MIKGEDVLIQFRLNSADFTDLICATECAIEGITETADVATLGTGSWKSIVPLTNGYKITLSGLIPLDTGTNNNPFDLFQRWINKSSIMFRMIFTQNDPSFLLRILEGEAIITSDTLNGPATGFATSEITLDGNGPLMSATTLCSTTLGTLSGSDGSYSFSSIPGSTVAIKYELFRNGILRNKGTNTVSGSLIIDFTLTNPPGNYSVNFYAICSNGLSGQGANRTFVIS